MAHQITVRSNGFAEAAFSRKPAWHGLGVVLDHDMRSQEAITAAGLDWSVVQYPLAYKRPATSETESQPEYTELPEHLANVREDTGLFLGNVTKWYKVVQNRDAFKFLDALVDDGELTYESAFSMNGGKQVVLLAKMPKVDLIGEEDEQLRYILMGLHHDGSGAIRFGATSVRVVCANTYGLALSKNKGNIRELSISHTGDIDQKLEQAKSILRTANSRFDVYAEEARRLTQCRLTRDQWTEFLNVMCPVPSKVDPDWTARREVAILETRNQISTRYFTSPTNTLQGMEETAWAAFNAVTEFVDHLPRRGATVQQKSECRFNVTQYGPGRDQKERAFEAACRLASGV
ncbi:DUF932 domain-containing protein [Planctomicrobium sp. SH668]|uniref:DUF932 domain-containing protein n=1 Tax=Planctomicrobium sp. SH668 TaxID=3448126 RepID=UPI003F5C49EB